MNLHAAVGTAGKGERHIHPSSMDRKSPNVKRVEPMRGVRGAAVLFSVMFYRAGAPAAILKGPRLPPPVSAPARRTDAGRALRTPPLPRVLAQLGSAILSGQRDQTGGRVAGGRRVRRRGQGAAGTARMAGKGAVAATVRAPVSRIFNTRKCRGRAGRGGRCLWANARKKATGPPPPPRGPGGGRLHLGSKYRRCGGGNPPTASLRSRAKPPPAPGQPAQMQAASLPRRPRPGRLAAIGFKPCSPPSRDSPGSPRGPRRGANPSTYQPDSRVHPEPGRPVQAPPGPPEDFTERPGRGPAPRLSPQNKGAPPATTPPQGARHARTMAVADSDAYSESSTTVTPRPRNSCCSATVAKATYCSPSSSSSEGFWEMGILGGVGTLGGGGGGGGYGRTTCLEASTAGSVPRGGHARSPRAPVRSLRSTILAHCKQAAPARALTTPPR